METLGSNMAATSNSANTKPVRRLVALITKSLLLKAVEKSVDALGGNPPNERCYLP